MANLLSYGLTGVVSKDPPEWRLDSRYGDIATVDDPQASVERIDLERNVVTTV